MSGGGTFRATETSLAIAEDIADVLGIPFDKTATKLSAQNLLLYYFNDIEAALVNEIPEIRFESFAVRDFSAFAQPLRGSSLVAIDEQWSLFLFTASILVCIRACVVLDEQELDETASLYRSNLRTFRFPRYHEILRERMRPYLLKYANVLPLANLLTNAMFAFMVCHEIAHCIHNHFNQEQSSTTELEADATGFGLLQRVSQAFQETRFLKVPPNMIGTPIIGLMYLRSLEMTGLISEGSETHPASAVRIESLKAAFNAVADADARYLFDGLEKGCLELMEGLS